MSLLLSSILETSSGMNKGGSGEANSHPKAGSDIRLVMLGSSCFESCKTKKNPQKIGKEREWMGGGCGKGGKKG